MDINFHYFAVKTIAIEAGFNENDAQIIAEYSQFIDDYSVWDNYYFKNVPDYAASLRSKTKTLGFWNFYTVTTGFDTFFDMLRLVDEKYQKEIAVPFHFIPNKRLKDLSGDRDKYRTVQADINGDSLIANLLRNAKDRCLKSIKTPDDDEHRYNLMRVGALLHIFADTYAHNGFSGWLGWENKCYIKQLNRSDPNKPTLIKDTYSPDFYGEISPLGHAEAGHAPDMSYASFAYMYASDKEQKNKNDYRKYNSRNNTEIFLKAAEQIYCILYQICHNDDIPGDKDASWKKLKEKLLIGLRAEGVNYYKLKSIWSKATNNEIIYSYSKKNLWEDQLIPILFKENEEIFTRYDNDMINQIENKFGYYETATDDFFHFNLIAKEIRDSVIE